MSKIVALGEIEQKAGVATRRALVSLDGRTALMEGTFQRIVRNGAIVASHADLQNLDFASSGHTGFASSAQLTAHTSNTSNPHATTLQQALAAGATATTQPIFNGGADLGTNGILNSDVVDGANVKQFLFKPTVTLAAVTARRFEFEDDAGNPQLIQWKNGSWEFGGSATAGGVDAIITVGSAISNASGIQFAPASTSSVGTTYCGQPNTVAGAYFAIAPTATTPASLANVIGAIFQPLTLASSSANVSDWWGIWTKPMPTNAVNNSARTFTNIGGWKVWPVSTAKNFGAITNLYGGYISDMASSSPASNYTLANQYGLWIDEQTRATTTKVGIWLGSATAAYKAIVIRDANAWIGSSAAARIDIGATEFLVQSSKLGVFNTAPIVQVTTAVAAATFVANTSGIANDTATWDGYTAGQVVKALRNYGILA